jgi:hypothetical protein
MAALSTGYINVWFTLRIKKKMLSYWWKFSKSCRYDTNSKRFSKALDLRFFFAVTMKIIFVL